MEYLITFLEGIISFISPCMLPMLPIYISYFAGGSGDKKRGITRAIAFVLGFTLVFTALGLFAGSLGAALRQYQTIVNIVCGVLVIIFGLSYLEVIHLPFFKGVQKEHEIDSFFSALAFGAVYSISLTPCVGAFLGSALMMAATGNGLKGAILLLVYSLGLGIPFILSAVLLDSLKGTFNWIKGHYKIINRICGIFLILVGLAMAFGLMNRLLSIFS
ncbi:MAG: cytochrome c biogenesis CcdA family protein [Pseudobutyrivibrio sp.]|nr:cytochrome c biogenesis CcdA family protein [Pseudobutyrivibrio sp.]